MGGRPLCLIGGIFAWLIAIALLRQACRISRKTCLISQLNRF
jgi:hypothetical protein